MKKIIFPIALITLCSMANAQVGINTPTPSASIDLVSKGNSVSTKALEINNSDALEIGTLTDNGTFQGGKTTTAGFSWGSSNILGTANNIALGTNNSSNGTTSSVSIGNGNSATGSNAVAVGGSLGATVNSAAGVSSLAIGFGNEVSGNNGRAFGVNNKVTGAGTAIGSGNNIAGGFTFGTGNQTVSNSLAIGQNMISTATGQVVLGYGSGFVGPTRGATSYENIFSNAQHLFLGQAGANGLVTKVGIGTVDPQQMLHVEGTARITGSTGTSTAIMGRNAAGDISGISVGPGMTLTGGTLDVPAVNTLYSANGSIPAGTTTRTITTNGSVIRFSNGTENISIAAGVNTGEGRMTATGNTRGSLTLNGGNGTLDLYQDTGSTGNILVRLGSTGLNLGSSSSSNAPVSLQVAGTHALTAINGGNVGIGTDVPSNKLHIVSAADPVRMEGLQAGNTAADQLLAVTNTGVVKQVGILPVASIPVPAVFSLTNTTSNFLNGVAAGESQVLPMTMVKNAIAGLTYNTATSTITFPAGLYQMTMVYEGEHNAAGCTLSSYLVDFPVDGGTDFERIHSTAAHNAGGTSNHGGSITYTSQIPAGRTWQIQMGRGQSGNCTGTGNILVKKRTQLLVYRLGD